MIPSDDFFLVPPWNTCVWFVYDSDRVFYSQSTKHDIFVGMIITILVLLEWTCITLNAEPFHPLLWTPVSCRHVLCIAHQILSNSIQLGRSQLPKLVKYSWLRGVVRYNLMSDKDVTYYGKNLSFIWVHS